MYILLTGHVGVEVLLYISNIVTVVLPVQAATVESIMPVFVLLLALAVGVVVALVEGRHQPVTEVGSGSTGSRHLVAIETEVRRGEGGDGGEDQDQFHHSTDTRG